MAVRIDLYVDPLAWRHVLKLSLLEVGSHPDIIERDDIHQFLSDAYVLADFRGLFPDNSGHRRANHGIAQVQFSLSNWALRCSTWALAASALDRATETCCGAV